MCSISPSSASSDAVATQISTAVARKVLDADMQAGAQAIALIDSARAIAQLNARAAAQPRDRAIDVYA